MSDPDAKNESDQTPVDKRIGEFRSRQRTWWRINAFGWCILGLGALIYLGTGTSAASAVGFIAGIALILTGIVCRIRFRLNRCPYCGGILLRNKCRTCGELWPNRAWK